MRRIAAICFLASAGCSDAPAPRAPVDVVQASGFVAPVPRPSLAATAPPGDRGAWPHHSALPASPACVLARSAFSGLVRLAPESEPFAYVDADARSDVHVPQGAPDGPAVVEASLGPLSLRGVVPTEELDLRPARPLRLGGLLWVQPYAALRVVRAASGNMVVKMDARLDDLTDLAAPLEADLPCASLRFDPAEFDPWDQLGKPLAEAVLRAPSVPLAATPGGARLARLTIEAGDEPVVSILARAAGHARIVVDRGDALLVAWVPARSLGPLPPSSLGPGGGGTGSGFLGTGAGIRPTLRACRAPLAIGVLQQDGVSGRVGTLDAGTPILVGGAVGDLTVVLFTHAALGLRNEARLVAMTNDLEGCAAVE